MAETLTYRIIIQEDVPGESWEEEDELYCYYDDVSDSIRVYVNDVTEIFGGPIISLTRAQGAVNVALRNQFYSFCNTNDLVQFQPVAGTLKSFPYIQKSVTVNSPTCTATSCDLVITSIDTRYFSDGTHNYSYIYTNYAVDDPTITYSIDGENYQVSPFFSNLPNGDYTAHVMQVNGCRYSAGFSIIGDDNREYYDKYEAKFDFRSSTGRLLIQEFTDVAPSVEQVKPAREISLKYPNQSFLSIYDYVIRPSFLEISLLSERPEQFIDMFTSKPKTYRAIYYLDGSEVWRGYSAPNIYSQPYRNPPYITTLSFTDQLSMLDRVNFSSVGIRDRVSLYRIISEILKQTGISIPIREAIGIYSTGMDSNYPVMLQTFIDAETFRRDEINCYEVLENLLLPFGVELLQQDGAWWIVRKERRTADFDYYELPASGIGLTTGTYSPLKLYTSADQTDRITNKNRHPLLDMLPAFGKITIKSQFGLRESLLRNYDFSRFTEKENGDLDKFDYWTWVSNGVNNVWLDKGVSNLEHGTSAVMKRTKVLGTRSGINGDKIPTSRNSYIYSAPFKIRYEKDDGIRLRFKIGFSRIDSAIPYLIIRAVLNLDSYYLKTDGTWDNSSGEQEIRFYPSPSDGFIEVKIEAELPETAGVITERTGRVKIFAYWSVSPEYDVPNDSDDISTVSTTDKPDGYKIDALVDNIGSRPDTLAYFNLEQFPKDDIADIEDQDIQPSDYNTSTNNRYWKRTVNIVQGIKDNFTFYIDDVEVDYLPQRFDPIEEQSFDAYTDIFNPEAKEFVLKNGVLPLSTESQSSFLAGDELTPNDRYSYDSQYTNSIAQPLRFWGRKGVNESVPLQFLFSNTVVSQHNNQTRRLSGSFTTQNESWLSGIVLKPLDSILSSFDGKYYIVEGFESLDINHQYNLEIVEAKNGGALGIYSEHTVSEHTNEEHS